MDILERKLLILASAGSGKTYQLSNRIIGLVARGADPERIVALTFTRKAAAEFADSMLTKLARAATDPAAAKQLEKDLGLGPIDFLEVLGRISRSLHRITLGTMDSFFARIVKAFQYELGMTGGRFELIEGPRQEMAADQILQHILGEVFSDEAGGEFSHAFRRASIGREQQGVARGLREFVKHWHLRYRHHPDLDWGPNSLVRHKPEDWEKLKPGLIDRVREHIDDIHFTDKRQQATLDKSLDELLSHTIASGNLGSKVSSLTQSMLDAVATQEGPGLTLKSYKEFEIHGPGAEALRELIQLAADCEMSAAVMRSRAVHEVITAYDRQCERLLRTRGRLGFDDVKLLMGQWAHSEEARLRREAIDFRLDARIDHWLLDEFQDTSRAEWDGLLPLIDEAASDEEDRTMFIVGDRKQAIYAWRGGDVGLFDQVIARYGAGLQTAELNESWRSCPEVLALVNQVCGDKALTREIFGEASERWDCPTHEPAAPLQAPEKRGHARVEQVDGWDEKYERMHSLLTELGVGERELTCAVLLRGNEQARKVADELRSRGFDVILEGQREPGRDCPVGVAVTHLLKWLADPGNLLARGVVEMSPFMALLKEQHGQNWEQIWSGLGSQISDQGYSNTVAAIIEGCGVEWSAFSRRRIQDLLQTLAEMDRRGNVPCREAAGTLERLAISQSPGAAAIQVMTIHKSKGLGFDVVILPEIPDRAVPEPQHFRVAQEDNWLSEAPPQWARRMVPELEAIETEWSLQQQHEAMCTLYVALTRAKRGLYVFLDPPSKNHDGSKPSLANWMMQATGLDEADAEPYEAGSIDWAQGLPDLVPPAREDEVVELPPAVASERATLLTLVAPSHMPDHGEPSAQGMAFGSEVHALLERVAWIDEQEPDLPDTPEGSLVRRLLDAPPTRPYFMREGRDIRLLREQSIDALVDGRWISGVIDRLHLHRNADGKVERIEIIDFKTDVAEDPSQLIETYREQVQAYRSSIEKIHPEAQVDCLLLSTHLGRAIEL